MEINSYFVCAVIPLIPESMLQGLPERNDNFENIRVNSKVFVDKSAYIIKLIKRRNKFVRICRPENFGKSNFLRMLGSFFSAKRTFFQDTEINANQSWKFLYPVIYLDFNVMNVTTVENFKADLNSTIFKIGHSYKLQMCQTDSIPTQFRELICGFAKIYRRPYHAPVILVDEYDWPVRRNADINDEAKVREMGDFLQDFFAVLKSERKSIRLAFLTCTMPLDLDYYSDGDGPDIVDISHEPEFNDMIGLTHQELVDNFQPHVELVAKVSNETINATLQKIRNRYGGYCFFPDSNVTNCDLYNFHSILSCLRTKNLSNFWKPTKDLEYNLTDRYRAEMRKRNAVMKFFSNLTIPRISLERSNHIDYPMSMEVCMVIYGYLTIRSYDVVTKLFTVDFPNDEVREKFMREMLKYSPAEKLQMPDILDNCNKLKNTLFDRKLGSFIKQLNTMTFQLKDNVLRSKYEYIDRVVRVLQTCDIESQDGYNFYYENSSLAGTIDLVAKGPDEKRYCYAIEFEMNKNVTHVMGKLFNFVRIQEFMDHFWYSKVCLLGINFGPRGGMIEDWIGVTYEKENFTDIQTSHPYYVKMYEHIISGTS